MLDETDKQGLNAIMRRTASESNRTTTIPARARLWTVAARERPGLEHVLDGSTICLAR